MLNRAPKKFFFDTEFHEHNVETANGRTVRVVELISIGVVDENGRTFYAVNSEFDRDAAEKNHFLKTQILDKLPPEAEWKTMREIQNELFRFIGSPEADFYHWQAPHDPLLLYELLSPVMYRDSRPYMMTVRENVHMVSNLGQMFNDLGRPRNVLPPKKSAADGQDGQHNALTDAQWDRDAYYALVDYERQLAAKNAPPAPSRP
jgi:hypothetical protein